MHDQLVIRLAAGVDKFCKCQYTVVQSDTVTELPNGQYREE